MIRDARARRYAGLALIAALALAGLGRGLWTPDEPREAEMAREMLLRPSMIPTLNGEPFHEKPPLYYALVAGAYAVSGGPSPAAARSVSAVAALLTLAALFAWARRERGTRAAWIAVMLFATSAGFASAAQWIRIDGVLMLFATIAAWSAREALSGRGGRGAPAAFYAALVAALWTKGLIGPVLAAAGLAAYAAARRSPRALRPLRPLWGVVVGIAAVGALAGAIALEGGREALWQWGYVNHVQRFVDPQGTGHRQPLTYYLAALPAMVFPWLFAFFDLFRSRARFWAADAAAASLKIFCGAWVLGGLAVLTASSTKREVYLLPVLPPLFLLMALAAEERLSAPGPGGTWGRWAWRLQAALAAAFAGTPAVAFAAYAGRVSPLAGLSAAVAVGAGAGVLLALRGDPAVLARRAFVAAAVGWLSVTVLAPPLLEPQKDYAPFVAAIGAALPAGEAVRAGGADETLLGIVPFVTGRRVVAVTPADLRGPQSALPRFVVLQSKDRERVWPEIEARYDLADSRDFGPGRRISLWRLKAG